MSTIAQKTSLALSTRTAGAGARAAEVAKSESQQCARHVMDAVLPVMWFIRRQMREQCGELSLTQFRVLNRITREPRMSLSALAEHLGASLSATSRAVTGLVERGLLVRDEAPTDRRQLSLNITQKGRGVLDRARSASQAHMAVLLASLSQQQRDTIEAAMSVLREVFGPLSDD